MNKNELDKKQKISLFPQKNLGVDIQNMVNASSITEALHFKIEPLIEMQELLLESTTKFSDICQPIIKQSGYMEIATSPLAESVLSLSDGLEKVYNTASVTNELLNHPIYDHLNNPMGSVLNAAVDSLKIGQERMMSVIQDNVGIASIKVANQVSQINTLNNMAIDSLNLSPALFPAENSDDKIANLNEKIQKLESKVIDITEKSDKIYLTDITENIMKILDELDSDIAQCFRGAMTILLEAKSEDMVGQVAESLTRVIEKLPFCLSKKTFPSNVNKTNVRNAICSLEFVLENDIDYLVEQQHYYYSTLGSIRHRNKKIYNQYNNDYALFNALAIQAEAFIYILITANNEN